MPKPSKHKLLLLLAILIAGALATFIPGSHALALIYPAPKWWGGNQCDSGNNPGSYVLGSGAAIWNGIAACGPEPGSGQGTLVYFIPGSNGEYEWNCTELVTRYLFIAFGTVPINATGDQVVANYASTYSSIFTSINNQDGSNSTNHIWPKAGDVISYSDVHTAIITGVTITDQANGNATLNLLEQNAASSGATTQKFVGWKIKGDIDDPNDTGSDTVSAWLTPKQGWTHNDPSESNPGVINSMSTVSSTEAWAAGHQKPSGQTNQPVTYHHDSTGWHRILPASQGLYNSQDLYGIAANSSGDAWTVGVYSGTNGYQTLAYHWSGSAWSKVTSDNPNTSSDNYLKSVAIDSSGNVYAAGYYLSGGYPQPFIEKWNGTKFAQQTIASLPSGCTNGQLTSISFSSSSSGWAVGYATCTSSNKYWLVYHFDGTNWNVSVSASLVSTLFSVVAISDSEAWAVGGSGAGSGTPLILHYTDANGWVQDSSFSGDYPSNTTLYGIGADSATDIWIVGSYSISSGVWPYTMHYNGYYWGEFDPPAPSSRPAYLYGVAVNSGDAWAGGYNGSTPAPIVYLYS